MTYRINEEVGIRVSRQATVFDSGTTMSRGLVAATNQSIGPTTSLQEIIYSAGPTAGDFGRGVLLNAQRAKTDPEALPMPFVVSGRMAKLRLQLIKKIEYKLLKWISQWEFKDKARLATKHLKDLKHYLEPLPGNQQLEREFLSNLAEVLETYKNTPIVTASSISSKPVSVHIVSKGAADVPEVHSSGWSVSAKQLAEDLNKTFNLTDGVVELHSDDSAIGDHGMATSLSHELRSLNPRTTVKGYDGVRLPKGLLDRNNIRFHRNAD